MAKNYPDIKPGEIVSGGFTYPNNAQVVGDVLYLRDANGNVISGRQVDNGDKITVLDVGYTKQLTLIQYPAGTAVRQGYVTNSTNIIKYLNQGAWKNGSTSETVYDENDAVLGSLDPYEVATPLYKASNGKTHVVYNTSKGANTKSGYVVYGGGTGSTNPTGGIVPGEVVPGGFTYPNNAQVVGDDLYLRDANGNMISGRQVSNGDRITVLDVGYTKQLTLVQYPAGSVVRQGYVSNATALIKYDRQGEWHNGSTAEEVLDENGAHLGSLNSYEAATPLYKKNGMTHVVYNTDKGPNTKSGYVRYEGSAMPPSVTIPTINEYNVQKQVYGLSGKGRELQVYKVGSGSKILFAGFRIHGFEDNWARDGVALATIAIELLKTLASIDKVNGLNGWTVYVAPSMNPDGLMEGWTNNGPGRCTITTSIDLNRSFPTGFSVDTSSRNYTGSQPLLAPEAKALSALITNLKGGASRMVLLDFHGWLNETLGNSVIGKFFDDQFGFSHNPNYGGGYFSTWANSLGIESALVEYPSVSSTQEALDRGFVTKTFNAIKGIIDSGESNSGGTGVIEIPINKTGQVINVTSNLNVRSSASISSSIIGSLQPNSIVNIISQLGEFYKIYYGNGVGYVSKDYVTIGSATIDNSLREGSQGDAVKTLQENLTELGFFNGIVTGYYDGLTSMAVNQFQLAYGVIGESGIAGVKTLSTIDYIFKNIYVLSLIEQLEKEADNYSNKLGNSDSLSVKNTLVLDFLRSIRYNAGFSWLITLGIAENGFIDYVKTNNVGLYNRIIRYINNKAENAYVYGEAIDLAHLAATTEGYIASPVVPNFWIGWGGDLATAMADVTGIKFRSGTDKTVDEIAESVIGNNEYSCSRIDIAVDIDSIAIASNANIARFSDIIKKQYTGIDLSSKRKEIIFGELGVDLLVSEEVLYQKIYGKITGITGFLFGVVSTPLYKLAIYTEKDSNNNVIRSIEPTKEVQIATCKAFAKYILNKL
ncbi:SH3 domain-containing protein [Clostridium sp. YIM B02505]|uniref:SH3 domain-containing protein n=1 Tax=Clostridium yunnanense TaxID=2800325 RepID=A0ABS1EMI4_9CLOT|nr:SH3 domain-containing protein [Clostridium yunnanense]MBK1810543.1 SH3 domain-containing protein [Clostridium yunnanense]